MNADERGWAMGVRPPIRFAGIVSWQNKGDANSTNNDGGHGGHGQMAAAPALTRPPRCRTPIVESSSSFLVFSPFRGLPWLPWFQSVKGALLLVLRSLLALSCQAFQKPSL